MFRIVFVAVDRTHEERSVTHSRDARGARTHRFGGSLPSHPVAVLTRVAWPCYPPPVLCSLSGMDRHPHAHNPSGRTPPALEGTGSQVRWPLPKISIAGSWGGDTNSGPGGKARAGTRRPSPCRVSAGRVFAFTGLMPTEKCKNFLRSMGG